MISLFSISEAAVSLGISSSRLRRMCNRGEINSVRTSGGHRRISVEEVQRLAGRSASTEATPSSPKFKILVADNSQTMRKAFELGLRQLKVGATVVCVDTGLSAIVNIERYKPHILLIDLEMGPEGFDGLQVVKAIQASEWHHDLAIIAVTGLDPDVVRQRGGLPASVLLFKKPVDWPRLKGCVEGILHAQRLAATSLPAQS